MEKLLFATAIAVTVFVFRSEVSAQVCGGSVRTYRVYVRNDFQAVNLKYELISVIPKKLPRDYESTARYLYKTFFPDKKPFLSRFWINEPHVVKRDVAETFLLDYKADRYLGELPDEPFSSHQNKHTDVIKRGEFQFYTAELFDRPYLLRVSADNYKPVYYIGDHLGGCRATYRIVLEDLVSSKR